MNFAFLLSYILLFVFFLWFYYKKKKNIDAGAVLIILYLVYAVLGLLLFFDKSSIENADFQDFDIQIFPLIYLFVCLIISFTPILSYNSKNYFRVKPPNFNLNYFAWFFILCYLLQIGSIASNLSRGLYMILFMDEGAAELYSEMIDKTSSGGIGIENVFSIFGNMLYGFGILLFYYYLSLPKKNKLIICGLGIAIIVGILEYASAGQRGGMIKRCLLVFGTFFFFKDYIGERTKKTFRLIGTIVASFFVVVFLAMSLSRFGDREGGIGSSFNRYGGEALMNFDRYAFDNNGIRYGDRVFPLFKRILQFDNVPRNFMERRAKYPRLHINDEVFITYIGDFCLDFGPIIAFIIILLFSIWVRSSTRCINKEYPFHKLIILHFAFSISIQGGSLFPYADTGNLVIITYFLLYWFFAIIYSSSTKVGVNIK